MVFIININMIFKSIVGTKFSVLLKIPVIKMRYNNSYTNGHFKAKSWFWLGWFILGKRVAKQTQL